ncbi:Transcriptional regulator, GntR family [Paraburkholderia caribensis]|nr:Transcriptional regulator, GntR family [Paraburkholderia caribensis]
MMIVPQTAAPLRQQVAENIRVAMLTGKFRPGDRLVERELVEMIGVSRTVIREALRQLESEGLVENIANRGPIVARTSRADAQGIYETRGFLEGLICKLFTLRASDEQVRKLRESADRLDKAYNKAEVQRLLELKADFYAILLEGAGNTTLEPLLRLVHARANYLRYLTFLRVDRRAGAKAEMRRLMKCVEDRDADGAELAARTHVENSAAAALSAMDESA